MKSIIIHNKATVNARGTHTQSTHKPVICITDRKFFISVTDASEIYNVCISSISKVCQHKYDYVKTPNGNKKFCYLSEILEHLDELFNTPAEETETLRKENEELKRKLAETESDAALGRAIREEHEREEKRQQAIAKARELVEQRKRICEQQAAEAKRAVEELTRAERELAELEGKCKE